MVDFLALIRLYAKISRPSNNRYLYIGLDFSISSTIVVRFAISFLDKRDFVFEQKGVQIQRNTNFRKKTKKQYFYWKIELEYPIYLL